MKKFDHALNITGLKFDYGTSQISNITGTQTDDLEGIHIRWNHSKYLEYPGGGCGLFRGKGTDILRNKAYRLDLQTPYNDRSNEPNYKDFILSEPKSLIYSHKDNGEIHGAGTWVGSICPYQMNINTSKVNIHAFQLTFVGADLFESSETKQTVKISIKHKNVPVEEIKEFSIRHLEMKVLYYENDLMIEAIRVEGKNLFLTGLELFYQGWHELMKQNKLIPVAQNKLIITDDKQEVRSRLNLPQSMNLDEYEEHFSLLQNLMLDQKDNVSSFYFREFELPSDKRNYYSDVEEDEPYYLIHPYDMAAIFACDAELARALGYYHIDRPETNDEDIAYVLTAHHTDTVKIDRYSENKFGESILAITILNDFPNEKVIPVKPLKQLKHQNPVSSVINGIELNWELDNSNPALNFMEPVIYELKRWNNLDHGDEALYFEKRFISPDPEKQNKNERKYLDLFHPAGDKIEQVFDYQLLVYDVWGRNNTPVKHLKCKYNYDPMPQQPVALSSNFIEASDPYKQDLNCTFLWGKDQFASDIKVEDFVLWVSGYYINEEVGCEILSVAQNQGEIVLNFDIPKAHSTVNIKTGLWRINIAGNVFVEESQKHLYPKDSGLFFYKTLNNGDVEIRKEDISMLPKKGDKLALYVNFKDQNSWDSLKKYNRAENHLLNLKSIVQPEKHIIDIELDYDKSRIYVKFDDEKVPFNGIKYLSPGSLVQEGREYILEQVFDEKGKVIPHKFSVQELFEELNSFIPENGEAVIYPQISYTFIAPKIKQLSHTSKRIRPFIFGVQAKDIYGTVSALSNIVKSYWINTETPDRPTITNPLKNKFDKATLPDYYGISSYTISWEAQPGKMYNLYRATEDMIFAELGNTETDLGLEEFRELAEDENKQATALLKILKENNFDHIFSKLNKNELEGNGRFEYLDDTLEGRSTAIYLYKISEINDGGLEGKLSDLVAIVKCPAYRKLENPVLNQARIIENNKALIEVSWNHTVDPNLGYYMLLKSIDEKHDHWRDYKTRIRIKPNEYNAPLRINFNVLDIAFLEQIDDLEIKGLFFKDEIEKNIGNKMSENVIFESVQGINLLDKIDLEITEKYIKGFDPKDENRELVIYYQGADINKPIPYYEHHYNKSYMDEELSQKGQYHYQIIAISKDEDRMSEISNKVSVFVK